MDWLGALSEMAKGFPGGQIFIGPILRLYDQKQKKQERKEINEKLDKIILQNKEIEKSVVRDIFKIKDETQSLKMAVDVTTLFLKEVVDSYQQRLAYKTPQKIIEDRLKVSKFPFPFSEQIMIDELISLFENNIQSLKDTLTRFNYKEIPKSYLSNVEFISTFVNTLIGQDINLMKNIFCHLYSLRPQSEVIKAACEFLSCLVNNKA
ncbi:MAG: hypothetical protein ACFFDN_19380 [Candidatus Hodarchaeota archaeon]